MAAHLNLNDTRQALSKTHQELLSTLSGANDETLHRRAAEGTWSLAEVLAHVSDARRFFIREAVRVISSPGSRMGRTIQDPGRISAVKEHGTDSASALRDALNGSHAEVMSALDKMSDADLEIPGEHVKFGRQTVGELIQHFIVEHEQKHVQQARRCAGSLS